MKKLALIINPVAGLGGAVGLKGSDGKETARLALSLGARPHAGERAAAALNMLRPIADHLQIYTCPGMMGEKIVTENGFIPQIVNLHDDWQNKKYSDWQLLDSGPQDTIEAAKKMAAIPVDLLLFAGGDGTARDICCAIGESLPVIGIPAGVKIHSAVYATNPINAGLLALEFLTDQTQDLLSGEVMDIDEEAFRHGRVSPALYGYLRLPASASRLQGGKMPNVAGDWQSLSGIADYIVEQMQEDVLYIIGPGSTTAAIMKRLSLPNTLLGVDLVKNHRLIASDVDEDRILTHMRQAKQSKIIVTPIGGQGYVFGRGNQQIGPAIIQSLLETQGKESIIIVASKEKLQSLYQKRLLVDSGSRQVDDLLQGYCRVVVGDHEEMIFRIG